jgi:hypothetical protein
LPTGRSRPATSATDVRPRRPLNGSTSFWETACRGESAGTSVTRRRYAPNWSRGFSARCGAAPRVGRTGGSAAPDTPARTHRR